MTTPTRTCVFTEAYLSGRPVDESLVQAYLPPVIGTNNIMSTEICPSRSEGCGLTLRALACSALGQLEEVAVREDPADQVPANCFYHDLTTKQFINR